MGNNDSVAGRNGLTARAKKIIGLVALPLAVFLALDLSVSPEISILRRSSESERLGATMLTPDDAPILSEVPDGYTTEQEANHMFFGMDPETGKSGDATESTAVLSIKGQWSGRFAGILADDIQASCWSAYDFDLHLLETDEGISGTGSYWVDPAECSLHEEKYVAFVDAVGVRRGNRVELEVNAVGDGATEFTFNGLMMKGRLAGWFYSTGGKPISGPIVLTRQ